MAALVLGFAPRAQAFDFLANVNGHTLYFNIISGTTNVELTFPNSSSSSWEGYTKPTGSLNLPGTVTNNGTTYTVTQVDGYAFSGCTGITSVTIPSSVQSIGNHAFGGCSALTSVTINSNAVASATYSQSSSYGIYYNNFRSRFGNQVTSYTFGTGVTAIGAQAFDGCSGIAAFTVKALTPPTVANANTFNSVPTTIPVYVRQGTKTAYESAQNWSRFTNIIEIVFFDDVQVDIPYAQPFATSTMPNGWGGYHGQLNWDNSTQTGTATLATTNYWYCGTANGHTDSHAYTAIGGNRLFKWLVSPKVDIDDEADGNITLSCWMALTRYQGTLAPIIPGNQDHQSLGIYYTTDEGATWHRLADFSGTAFESIPTTGGTYYYNLDALRGQTVRFGIYAACTNASDAVNKIHVDDFNVQTYDLTAVPTAVAVSEVAGHSAKVSWTAANVAQQSWDVVVNEGEAPSPNLTAEQLQQISYYHYARVNDQNAVTITGLEANHNYKAYVRYNDDTNKSQWATHTDYFETEALCAAPTNIQVETTTKTIFVSWEPGQVNQTSWTVNVIGSDVWEYQTTNTSITIDAQYMFNPGESFEVSVTGYCTDGDGDVTSPAVQAQMQPLPTLTLNDGNDYSSDVVIQMDNLEYGESWSQFVIPASQLTDMQYSTISKLQFYGGQSSRERNNEDFTVYLKEVDFDNVDDYCGDAFYDWSEMSVFYQGTLTNYSSRVLTIEASDMNLFHYQYGNLLVGIYQNTKDNNTQDPQIAWDGVNTTANVALAPEQHDMPFCDNFLPKTTFTYEPDPYQPPTDLQAEFVSANELYYSWTLQAGQTATYIQIASDAAFGTVLAQTNSTDDQCTVSFNFDLVPETNYYIRAQAVYGEGNNAQYSDWGATFVLTTPDACESPASLTASNIGPFSATLNWASDGEYVDVEYREVLGEEEVLGDPVINYGFESSTLPFGWSTTNNGTGTGWSVSTNASSFAHNGSGCLGSAVQSSKAADSWLFIPVSNKRGVLTFWTKLIASSTATTNRIEVYVTRSAAVPGTSVLPDYHTNVTSTTYREITVNLDPAIVYSTIYYIAIRHVNASAVTASTGIVIDDIKFSNYETQTNYGDWTSLGTTTENSMELTGLTPGNTYQFRVKSHCDTGYTSAWSTSANFTTDNSNIVFQNDIARNAA